MVSINPAALRMMGSLLVVLLLSLQPAVAQETTYISLSTASTTLQTGEIYEVQVLVENVRDLWVTSFEISYDPARLYIVGTRSGSPVQAGPLLADKETLVPRNRVELNRLRYTVSLLAPAEPINGTGVLATFRIAPLTPGPAQLLFRQANLTSVAFEQTAEGRSAGEPQSLAFTPVLLDLMIEGEPVGPPPEVTATPPPTSTPLAELTEEAAALTEDPEGTLVNITRAPATPAAPETQDAQDTQNPVLLGALALLVVSGIALLVLGWVYLRRYRR